MDLTLTCKAARAVAREFSYNLFDLRVVRFCIKIRVPRPKDLAQRVRGVCELQKNGFIAQNEPLRVVSWPFLCFLRNLKNEFSRKKCVFIQIWSLPGYTSIPMDASRRVNTTPENLNPRS